MRSIRQRDSGRATARLRLAFALLATAAGLLTVAQSQAPSTRPAETARAADDARIVGVLDEMVSRGETYLSVPPADGRALRLLAEAAHATRIVEIGTSTGYSGLWFCLALRHTGGHLTTFELDHGRAVKALEHFKAAGVESLVTVIEGDAHRQLAQVNGTIDVVFIDADKEGYLDYLRKLEPLVRSGGLILAHNVEMVPEYMSVVTHDPRLETIVYSEGAGLAITLKK